MGRRGYCRDVEYQDAAYQELRGALPWNQDVAAARHRASRQPGGQAWRGWVHAARLDAEPALAAVEPRVDSPARLVRRALRVLRVRRVRLARRALRVRRVPQLPSLPAPLQLPPPLPEQVLLALPRALLRRRLLSLLSSWVAAAARSPTSL